MTWSVVDLRGPHRFSIPTLVAIALVSAALIAYEIVLMRRLLIESWHHFGYLVISTALLGFGASGTLLALVQRRVRARPQTMMFQLLIALALALLAMPRVARLLPTTTRLIPGDLWRQFGWWSLYWLTALTPFLIGATFLGVALMTAGRQVGRVYAANLFGSGLGAGGALLIVSRFPIEYDLWPSLALVVVTVLLLPIRETRVGTRAAIPIRLSVVLVLAGLACAANASRPLLPAYDEHKYAARLGHLTAQGSARRVTRRCDPHGFVEVYASSLFHELPFVALTEMPPPMYSLVINGDPAGSILRIRNVGQARVMDQTLMALPYRLIQTRPAVLLIGEAGGANVWLARRRAARRIDVVQPNAALVEILREYSAPLFDDAGLRFLTRDPRTFVARPDHPGYDLIQIVSLEGLGVASAGMRGLAEDHLATVEGFGDCLRALSDEGLLAVSRGIQQPARENVRIFATLVEALESIDVEDPARHMIQVRDYLGVCTIAARAPLDDSRREALRAAIRDFNLTPVWYAGLPRSEVNRPDELDGPPGTRVDWLHTAAREILSPRRARFYDSWSLNVRPARDDQPFFWDFYKPGAVAELKKVYGDLWLTRAELGRLFLYASLLIAGGAAVALILLPLGVVELRRRKSEAALPATARTDPVHHECPRTAARSRSAAPRMILYFAGIGLGFMALEMALISRAIRWLGDPVIASAFVIGGVLVVSGIGSLTGQRVIRGGVWLAAVVVALSAGVVRLVGWNAPGSGVAGPWPLLLVALSAAYFMGMPMPAGIAALNRHSPQLVPWAWGVNGVASVVATSAAIVVAMAAGYGTVVIFAAAAYALAALAAGGIASP